VEFSQAVLQIEPHSSRGNSVACVLEAGTLALWRQSACAACGLSARRGAPHERVLMEYAVADVEREDARLTGLQVEWVQELTTQAWGHRAFDVRAPEGNVLNLHTAVEEQRRCAREERLLRLSHPWWGAHTGPWQWRGRHRLQHHHVHTPRVTHKCSGLTLKASDTKETAPQR
jgi:hypothetical protein